MHFTSFGLKRPGFAVRHGYYSFRLADFFGGLTRSIRRMASSKSMSSFSGDFPFFFFTVVIIPKIFGSFNYHFFLKSGILRGSLV
jgi:hypothetical protein